MGDIDVQMLPESAPLTVRNFLNLAEKGAYNNSFFHRLVRGFVLQGGGYTFRNGQVGEVEQVPPLRNEYRVSNTRGTLAMAKLGNDPNSATNQWFFNLADNSANLNNQNGGFTVFARVANAAGLAVMDRMAAVPVYNSGSAFDTLPLQNYRPPAAVTEANLILIRSITVVNNLPAIASNGVITVGNFGGFAVAAPGSFIEIYGSNLAPEGVQRGWAGSDFNGAAAPTTLAGVSVTVDGKPAYVSYVSPGQVNVQIPADVARRRVPVVVTTNGVSTAAAEIEMQETAGGILAPPAFKTGDRQFVAATHQDGSFVTAQNPAKPGETITFYGIGFGAVTQGAYAGQIAGAPARTVASVGFRINDIPLHTDYAGLAPGFVGLYQFNAVVPPESVSGDHRLVVLVDGAAIRQQELFISVQR
jgi:uncharacterized protein (TIGR03437 family)